MSSPESIVVVGESLAGTTAARELRARGFTGRITLIGNDADGAYARPPLSKEALRPGAGDTSTISVDGLDVEVDRSGAVGLDTTARLVRTAARAEVSYDRLIIATGASARRLAQRGQSGELVLRTRGDASHLADRLDTASRVIVVGAGFLGMEVASACAARGLEVVVVDVEPPLTRVLGPFLADRLAGLAASSGVRFITASGPVGLVGDPVRGVCWNGQDVLRADLVVTCAGDIPCTDWLAGTGLADGTGVGIDDRCATTVPDVFAAGDVSYLRSLGRRTPYWSNAIAQGKLAAASALGQAGDCATDDYFWTEVCGVPIKVMGPLGLEAAPDSVDGSLEGYDALLTWERSAGRTVVAFGRKLPVGRLRTMAQGESVSG
ncbi:MAG TPA: FAD-dependent oxidoreductase [Nocardioidaceae bacterium]|nr:FAD-dependent oxidoreductase [Nocardioidaceae bacterium]